MIRSQYPTRCLFALALIASVSAIAQDKPSQDAIAPMIADPGIADALKQVSAERIRANIEKLVSFGTRSTISAQDPASIAAGRGIGAAREWIKSEFERYSKDCGGCLEVKTDTFTEVARRAHSATHRNHQCLCGSEGYRRGEREAHRPRHRTLRFAQQRHLQHKRRRARSERRRQRNRGQPGMRPRVEQAEVSRNHHLSHRRRRRARPERQPALRQDGEGRRAGIWKRC